MKIFAILTTLVALSSFAGCVNEQAAADDDGAEGSEDLKVRPGYTKLRSERDPYVYTGIAVRGGKAFLASNNQTIDVINLTSMKKEKTLTNIAAESLAFDNGKLVACGMRDDSAPGWPAPRDGLRNNYVISFLSPESGKIQKEVVLKLESYLATLPGDLVDLPNVSCRVGLGTIAVAFAQEKLQHEVIRFAVPSEAKTSLDFRDVPGAERYAIGKPKRSSTIVAFAFSKENGLTLASGGYGLERLEGQNTNVFRAAASREHMVDVWDDGGTALLAVDHSGKLLSLDAKTAAVREQVEIPDWLEAVTVSGGFAYVAGRKGIFVHKLRR
jgi:hypothetical protein